MKVLLKSIKEVSFWWSHRRISSLNSKVTSTEDEVLDVLGVNGLFKPFAKEIIQLFP